MIEPIYDRIQPHDLPYRFEFAPSELEAITACNDNHGFALVRGLLPDHIVSELVDDVWRVVDPERTLGPGESRSHLSFIETARAMWQMLEYEPFMALHRALVGAEDLTINRSAAIIRQPGSKPVGWHSDWGGDREGPPRNTGDVLNSGMWPSGKWFYITGSRPSHGGLCVIEDSHVKDWPGPEGFELTEDRRSFYRPGTDEVRYDGFDVPGLVPLFTEPGDCIVFAHRTQHAAFPNREDQPRLSCAVGFRPTEIRIDAPWKLPESGERFVAELPQRLWCYVDGYTGIDPSWKSDA
ncbi:MAG: phytanoyl-CoA dioxygenase family protein [Candidatus Latescibacterota bacterium]|nr:phytanoyl-CoA dioxygenase family protein [Candidatus Latescibacterota bacterium]